VSRRRFTEREVLTTLITQGAVITCPRCKEPLLLGQMIDREHFHELALGGKDEPQNCFYSHAECHSIVTNGTKATSVGSSKHKIAKTKRLEAERLGTEPEKPKRQWPSRPIQSRGFKP
jgi:5-methylcytosine-specific restriction endonuclease McrA